MKKIFAITLLSIAALSAVNPAAQAHEASGGAYATWCVAGFVAAHTGTRVAKEKYGKAVSGATELAVSLGGCAAADAGLYSLTDHPSEAPAESDLNQDATPETQEQN